MTAGSAFFFKYASYRFLCPGRLCDQARNEAANALYEVDEQAVFLGCDDDHSVFGPTNFLTGAIDASTTFDGSDFRIGMPRFSAEARNANQAIVDVLGDIATRKRATRAQVALAWLLAQQAWVVPIPGTTKLHRLDENLGAAELELDAGDLRDIRAAADAITLQGARYPEHLQKLVGR